MTPEITPEYLDRLEALAEKAECIVGTDWANEEHEPEGGLTRSVVISYFDSGGVQVADCEDDEIADYIAAASPDVVRALVQEWRVAREALRYHLVGHSVSRKIGTPMSIAEGVATFDEAILEARAALGLEATDGP